MRGVGVASYPVRVEGQAADGPNPLAHEAVVVLDVADDIAVGVVHGYELVHGATEEVEEGDEMMKVRKRGRDLV